jgi:glycosyltransferase involved in cell wall biosynthesis
MTKVCFPFTIPRIRKVIRSIGPDILIGYRLTSYGFLAACSGFRPLVLASDGGDVQVQAKKHLFKRELVKYAISRADLVHAWSQNVKDALLDLGVPEDLVLLSPRGIELDVFKSSSGSQSAKRKIVTTRSLTSYCRIEIILRALALSMEDVPDLEYIVIGDGPERGFLENLANKLGIGKAVRFIGRMDRRQIADILGESEIYCSMLETDGLSASLHEAMAAGAFPIVTDIAANRIWINDGENGFLVKANDVEKLAGCVLRAMNDEKLLEKAKKINRSIVERKADIRRNMQVFEERYLKLLN